MEAKEVRFGNMVFDHKGEVVGLYRGYDLEEPYGFNPIPLTDEWLEKFNEKLIDNGYSLTKTTTGRFDVLIGFSYLTSLEFVHEYQNLFYCLMGNDLTLK